MKGLVNLFNNQLVLTSLVKVKQTMGGCLFRVFCLGKHAVICLHRPRLRDVDVEES